MPSQALRYAPATAGTAAVKRNATSTKTRQAPQARVYVLRDGSPVRVAVTAGLDDDTYTEIVTGDLKPGEQVIVGEQREAAKAAVPRPRL